MTSHFTISISAWMMDNPLPEISGYLKYKKKIKKQEKVQTRHRNATLL